MNQDNIRASIDSIETFGLVDGPGIRVVVFFNGCKLRCKYCHNPEMWTKKGENYSPQELVDKIKRYKSYFKDNGGVTFSGGEPLLHSNFIIETAKLLKEENIHINLYNNDILYSEKDCYEVQRYCNNLHTERTIKWFDEIKKYEEEKFQTSK